MTRQKTNNMLDFEPVSFDYVLVKYYEKQTGLSTTGEHAIGNFIAYLANNSYMLVQLKKEVK